MAGLIDDDKRVRGGAGVVGTPVAVSFKNDNWRRRVRGSRWDLTHDRRLCRALAKNYVWKPREVVGHRSYTEHCLVPSLGSFGRRERGIAMLQVQSYQACRVDTDLVCWV